MKKSSTQNLLAEPRKEIIFTARLWVSS